MASSNRALSVPPQSPAGGAAGSLTATNDIRTNIELEEISDPWFWVIVIGIGLAIAALIAWLIRVWSRHRELAAIEPPVPPHVRARQQLDAALRLIGQPREFSFAVSDALRTYLEERFRLRAPERTTEEFLRELEITAALVPDQKMALRGFLEQSDLVKFARYEPTEEALRELHGAALRLVDETALTASVAPPAPSVSEGMPAPTETLASPVPPVPPAPAPTVPRSPSTPPAA